MSTVHPDLARFAANLNDLWVALCEKEDPGSDFWDIFAPVSIKLYTGDGLTAKFWEDGIEFYPKEGQ